MARIVYPQPANPEAIDLSWMIGRTFVEVTFDDPTYWWFGFAQRGSIGVHCPWRILQHGRRRRSSEDHQQQYGLPAPIDAAVEATELLSAAVIAAAQIRIGPSDILIDFSGDLRLEILPISSGYEGWKMTDPSGTEYFAQGSGQICVLHGGS